MNIKIRKKTNENSPQRSKFEVTYPVPDKIDTTLKAEILKLIKKFSWLLKNRSTSTNAIAELLKIDK